MAMLHDLLANASFTEVGSFSPNMALLQTGDVCLLFNFGRELLPVDVPMLEDPTGIDPIEAASDLGSPCDVDVVFVTLIGSS